jgi:hypothetical protein
MKITLTTILWMAGLTLLAQPEFEHTYQESANICYLESLGEVYYSMDVINKKCLIYNMDHTLLKSIPLPTPEGYYLADIQYISETLFNRDNLIELVYIFSKYDELLYHYTFNSKLINETGTQLVTFPPGVGFTQVIETADQGKKFLAYEYDYSVIPYRTYTHVYSLPEESTRSVSHSFTAVNQGDAYPNPASHQVTIPVSIPDGNGSGTLVITDLYGRKVESYPIGPSTRHVLLPARQLPPGTYLYQVHSGTVQSEAKKLVIGE